LSKENTERNELMMSYHDEAGKRLDLWLSENNLDMSRTYLKKLINNGQILVNGSKKKANYRLKPGDTVRLCIPEPKSISAKSEPIDISVIYEDEHLLIIDKPQGMVVHPAAGNRSGTLVNALLHYCGDKLSDISGVLRPGIVHRLDKDTSGVIVVAKTNLAHKFLVDKFKKRRIKKIYHAIVEGIVEEKQGKIDAPVGRHPVDRKKMQVNLLQGRDAVTHFKVIKRFSSNVSMLKINLETGRTHQIRVHMAFIGHPVLGDKIYGNKQISKSLGADRLMLHASLIGFEHPVTGEYIEFESSLPDYFKSFLENN
jgi:23S rRNA pseudouridine1911/1915/1917 synthase